VCCVLWCANCTYLLYALIGQIFIHFAFCTNRIDAEILKNLGSHIPREFLIGPEELRDPPSEFGQYLLGDTDIFLQ